MLTKTEAESLVALMHVGQRLSNSAFNNAGNIRLDDRTRTYLEQMRLEWDQLSRKSNSGLKKLIAWPNDPKGLDFDPAFLGC